MANFCNSFVSAISVFCPSNFVSIFLITITQVSKKRCIKYELYFSRYIDNRYIILVSLINEKPTILDSGLIGPKM